MKKKIKKLLKNRMFIFTVAALLFGTIGVSAATYFPSNDVTYDNKESGLVSTDVQGAIDELYVKAQQLSSGSNDKVEDMGGVNSSGGDGLYKDAYEEGRYFYKGANPNNYITFNGETAGWRIMSLESDGTIKIIKTSSIGNMSWDSNKTSNWRTATLNTYLNDTYYNSLNVTTRGQIVSHNFSIGGVNYDDSYYSDNYPSPDTTDNINAENEQIWNGKVALPTLSEFLRANSNTDRCRTIQLYSNNNSICNITNWMYMDNYYWTLTLVSSNTYYAFAIAYNHVVGVNGGGEIYKATYGVRPVVYLSSSVKLSGSGTQSDPYTIN